MYISTFFVKKQYFSAYGHLLGPAPLILANFYSPPTLSPSSWNTNFPSLRSKNKKRDAGGGGNPERRRKTREMQCKQFSIYVFPKRFSQTSLILWTKYFHNRIIIFYLELCSDKKEEKTSLTYKEVQSGAVAKSYMRKGFLIYEEMRFDFFSVWFSVVLDAAIHLSALGTTFFHTELWNYSCTGDSYFQIWTTKIAPWIC